MPTVRPAHFTDEETEAGAAGRGAGVVKWLTEITWRGSDVAGTPGLASEALPATVKYYVAV